MTRLEVDFNRGSQVGMLSDNCYSVFKQGLTIYNIDNDNENNNKNNNNNNNNNNDINSSNINKWLMYRYIHI